MSNNTTTVTPQIESKVYNMISSQDFEDWFKDKFMDHITGEKEIPREEILEDIKLFLH